MTRTRNLSDLLDSGGDVKSGALDNAFDGAYSSLTGTPTTLSGYGITDAAPAASPTFTGDATFDSSTLHVDSTNNRVGIGTTGPAEELDITAAVPTLRFTDSTTSAYTNIVGRDDGGIQIEADQGNTQANSVIIFKVDATERMRVNGAGNVGIGTSSPSFPLHISSSGDTNARSQTTSTSGEAQFFVANSTGDGGLAGALIYGSAKAAYGALGSGEAAYYSNRALSIMSDAGASGIIKFATGGNTERFRMETDGDFHADGDVIAYSTTISDERLKTNIQGIENAVSKVGQLNGYTFEYTTDGKISAGVIAQEVEQVLPEAVSEKQLPLKADDGQEYKVVNYDALHGLLIEAIKELTARIEELEAK